jgi:hypothetical protein
MIKYNAPILERKLAQVDEMSIYISENSDYVLDPKDNRGSRMNSTIL